MEKINHMVQLQTYNVFLPYGIKNVKKKKATTYGVGYPSAGSGQVQTI
jgi:hypothetical protein